MIKFENTSVMNMKNALRGMRNPLNSWDKADSKTCEDMDCLDCKCRTTGKCDEINLDDIVEIGINDLKLAQKLIKLGTEHSKFLRQIFVSVDIIAPLYWWKQFDTYKVATVGSSCSTMHKIHAKEFNLGDFSIENLFDEPRDFSRESEHSKLLEKDDEFARFYYNLDSFDLDFLSHMKSTIDILNNARYMFLKTKDKKYWKVMIDLLPESYNQKRTVTMNYEVLKTIYRQRKNHKLNEWSIGFVEWVKGLPFAEELIMI